MMNIRLAKEFSFEMAHALKDYDGLCENIHGHSYKLEVVIIGPVQVKGEPKGMVMDFKALKKLVKDNILADFDHALVLADDIPAATLKALRQITSRIILTPFNPTSENLLAEFSQRIKNALPEFIKLHHLRLQETETSYAEYFEEDNPEEDSHIPETNETVYSWPIHYQ